MKLHILSDLHFEFHKDLGKSFIQSLSIPNNSVLVLAGDIFTICKECPINLVSEWAKNYSECLYVTGNHEYYNNCIPDETEAYWNQLPTGYITRLNREIITINEQRFLGCSLWFPNQKHNQKYYKDINDFKYIKKFHEWVYEKNKSDVKFLYDNLQPNDVVITHYLPSFHSIHPKYAGDNLNRFFVCDLTDLILERKPKLWIHGHTHDSMDYILGQTRIVANPFGYATSEMNKNFNEQLIVEV